MQRILVTGANKGIGLAIVEAILREQTNYGVFLASRDIDRGNTAREQLLKVNEDWSERIEVIELDVGSDRSVEKAAGTVSATGMPNVPPLYGLVNNAGVATGTLSDVLNVNAYGNHRVCKNFVPMLVKGGRIANVTSAAGPNFVAECSVEWKRFFLDSEITWEQLDKFMRECLSLAPGQFIRKGLGTGRAYGLSKACANLYSMYLARTYPELVVNACTPGFIETDLGMHFVRGTGRTPRQAGMKSPAEGARAAMFLLFDPRVSTGCYYGSDCLRSPLDRYRAPGSPAYTGD